MDDTAYVSRAGGRGWRRPTRRTFLAASGAATGMLLTACGGPGGSPETSASTKPPVTILFGTSLSERQQQNYTELLVQPFEAKFPGIRVDIDPSAHATTEKFKAAMAAGTVYDGVWEADVARYLEGFVVDMA